MVVRICVPIELARCLLNDTSLSYVRERSEYSCRSSGRWKYVLSEEKLGPHTPCAKARRQSMLELNVSGRGQIEKMIKLLYQLVLPTCLSQRSMAVRLLRVPFCTRSGLIGYVTSQYGEGCGATSATVVFVPARGKKQNFGAFTRDPFKTFQKKLAKNQNIRDSKLPLMSKEREQRSLLYPLNVQSIGKGRTQYHATSIVIF